MTLTTPESPGKTCHKCGKEKPLAAFSRHPRTADGLKTYCNACHGEAIAAGRRRRREAKAAMALLQHPLSPWEEYDDMRMLITYGFSRHVDAAKQLFGKDSPLYAAKVARGKKALERLFALLGGAGVVAAGEESSPSPPPRPAPIAPKAGWSEERRRQHSELMKAFWQQRRTSDAESMPTPQPLAEE